MQNTIELSQLEGRKLVLQQQRVHQKFQGKSAIVDCLNHLGYLQIDSISVVARAHHHTLWNRVKNYRPQNLSALLNSADVFEYWSHAAAYLPISDYRFTLPRKHAIASGERHWFNKDPVLAAKVKDQITECGPLMAKDFASVKKQSAGWWDWKPAKQALEQLFMEGELMVSERRGFQKVYDLTERVLPSHVDSRMPDETEYLNFLIVQYLQANALAQTENFSYLLKGVKQKIQCQLANLLEDGKIIRLSVNGVEYWALPQILNNLQQKLTRSKVKILSPFDNVLIQRKRMKALFDFDYQIECYVPQSKRQYGYFSLPLLWGQVFAGRMDTKVDRKLQCLHLQHLHLETHAYHDMIPSLAEEIYQFMLFNDATTVELHHVSHQSSDVSQISLNHFKIALQKVINAKY